jgi:hypothetical protein
MKPEKIAYRFLIIATLLTVISGKIDLPFFIKYINIFVLICIGTFYIINPVIQIISSGFKDKIPVIISEILFVFTSAFLVIVQPVHSTGILTAIKIMAITNAIYSIFLNVWFDNKNLSVKHFIISALLIGVAVFIPVSSN